MKVRLIYTGRSGRFKHGKTYDTTFSSVGRCGSKSPSHWIFTLKSRLKLYRITQYEFKKYWRYEDPTKCMTLLLHDIYKDSRVYMEHLTYSHNPLLAMIPKDDSFGGSYYPVPIVYKDPK